MTRKTITTIALIGGVALAGGVIYFTSRPEEHVNVPETQQAPGFVWPTPEPQIVQEQQPTPAPHVASVNMTAETGTSEVIMALIAIATVTGAFGLKRSLAS